MPDFDIDSLKKTWQEHNTEAKYSQDDILKMLNRKSVSYVKYIFWISAFEFLLFLIGGVSYLFSNEDDNSLIKILEKLGVKKTYSLEMNFEHMYFLMKVVSLLITGFFAIKFYLNYRKINVEDNLKKLIIHIFRFRRTVKHYIATNFALFFVYLAVLIYFVIHAAEEQNVHLDVSTLMGFILGITLTTAFILWAYYSLVYGIINRRLGKNLAQLKKIDDGNL